MKWQLVSDGFNTGQHNMDYDLELAAKCDNDSAFLRFYRWEPYCISLGANQKYNDINLDKVKEDGLEVVKRPTGGRAILHAEELTYSAIVPLGCGLSNREIYTKISLALVRGLKIYDSNLSAVELENVQPNFPDLLNQPSGVLCFASTAKSEVKHKGKKLIGSAQRKMNSVVLQHGSILCGTFHTKLPEYLQVDNSEIEGLNNELKSKTTELETILNTTTDYAKLEKCLIQGFEEEWNISF
ncbi:MAG: biotin/lipoate A/B protein ligase family protein [Rhodothermaceae bacterium]